jgi:hypothetical protein
MMQSPNSTAAGTPHSRLGDFINHENVFVRLASLWLTLMSIFIVVWYVSFYLLPEGLLRSTNTSRLLPEYAGSVWAEFLMIFAINLTGCLVIAAFNTLRSIRTPAGYVIVASVWIQGAITWGTNSLAIEAGRLAPSLSVLLSRGGIFELTAYVAVAVATRELVIWHQQSGPRWREEFERLYSPRDWHLSRSDWLVLAAGVLLLGAANFREAFMISHVVG